MTSLMKTNAHTTIASAEIEHLKTTISQKDDMIKYLQKFIKDEEVRTCDLIKKHDTLLERIAELTVGGQELCFETLVNETPNATIQMAPENCQYVAKNGRLLSVQMIITKTETSANSPQKLHTEQSDMALAMKLAAEELH